MVRLATIWMLAIAASLAWGCDSSDDSGEMEGASASGAAGDGSASPGDGSAGSGDGAASMEEYALIPCDDTIPEFTLGLRAEGRDGNYVAEIVSASPSPPEKFRNDWVVRVLDTNDEPMSDGEMTEVQPYMPAHGHDGLFMPSITPGEGAGEYQLGNLNLWMGGPWEVRLWVDGGAGSDYIVFNVCIES
jgi:hypothetical protein